MMYPAERKRSKIGIAIALILAGLAAWGLYSWWAGHTKPEHEKSGAPVTAAPVVRQDMPVYLDGVGTVQAYNTVTVHTQVDGQLMKLFFTEGQEVRAGQKLALIDPRTYEAQYEQAIAVKAKDEANLANAQHDLERYRSLGEAISRQILDTQASTVRQLQATVASDQAAIDNTHTLLSYTAINAPISGRTGIRQVDEGNIVHVGDANGIVVLTQLAPIFVIFSLPQQHVLEINQQIAAQDEKLHVLAVGPDNKTTLDEGTLDLIDNEIDTATGAVKLRATMPNKQRLLWPGGFVNVRLLLTTRPGSLVVPAQAVQLGPQGSYVYVLKDDSTVALTPVKVAFTENQLSVIDSGVEEGQQVVTEGMAKLQDKSKVSVAKPVDGGQLTDDKKEPFVSRQPSSVHRRKAQ